MVLCAYIICFLCHFLGFVFGNYALASKGKSENSRPDDIVDDDFENIMNFIKVMVEYVEGEDEKFEDWKDSLFEPFQGLVTFILDYPMEVARLFIIHFQ